MGSLFPPFESGWALWLLWPTKYGRNRIGTQLLSAGFERLAALTFYLLEPLVLTLWAAILWGSPSLLFGERVCVCVCVRERERERERESAYSALSCFTSPTIQVFPAEVPDIIEQKQASCALPKFLTHSIMMIIIIVIFQPLHFRVICCGAIDHQNISVSSLIPNTVCS